MRIEKIKIKNFGSRVNLSCEISSKINILPISLDIVIDFITFLFFGFTDEERSEYVNEETPLCEGFIVLNSNEKRYTLIRRDMLTRDLRVPCIATLIDNNTDKELFSVANMGERLLGINREVFKNSCILDSFPEDYDISGLTVDTENSLMLADGRLNLQYALTLTDSDISAARPDGRIAELSAQAEAIKEQIEVSEKAYARIYALDSEIYKRASEQGALAEARSEAQGLEHLAHSSHIIEDFDKLHELEDLRREQAQDIERYREENGYNGFCPDEGYRRRVALAYRNMRESNARYRSAVDQYCKFNAEHSVDKSTEEIARRAEALGGVEKVRVRYNEAHTSHRVLKWSATVMAALLLLTLFWGFATNDIGSSPIYYTLWALSLFLLLSGTALLFLFARKYKNLSLNMAQEFGVKAQEDLQAVLRRIEELKDAVGVRKDTLDAINLECDLSKTACDITLAEFKRAIEEWGEHLPSSELDEFMYDLDIRIEEYIKGETVLIELLRKTQDDIAKAREELASYDEVSVRAGIRPAVRKQYREMDYDVLKDNLSRLISECALSEAEISELKEEHDRLISDTPSVSALQEQLADIQAVIRNAKERAEYSDMAQRVLSDAEHEIRLVLSPRIASNAALIVAGAEPMGGPSAVSGAADTEPKSNFDSDKLMLDRTPRGIAYIAMKQALISSIFKESFPIMLRLDSTIPAPAVKQILRTGASVIANGGQIMIFSDSFDDTSAEFSDKIKRFVLSRKEVKA